MMVFGIFMLALISLSQSGSIFDPSFHQESVTAEIPPDCRPATQEELEDLGIQREGKASTFQLRGQYRCERPIFEYGDRNSFYTFISNHAGKRADEIAVRLAKWSSEQAKLQTNLQNPAKTKDQVLFIEVLSDTPELNSHIAAVFQTSIAEHAPSLQLMRLKPNDHTMTLRVMIRKIDDPILAIGASIAPVHGSSRDWIDL